MTGQRRDPKIPRPKTGGSFVQTRPKPERRALPRPGELKTIILFKPYGVLSQFTPEGRWESLAAFGPFPPDLYPVGRLDADSEGLLLLTNNNTLKHRLTDPRFGHSRTYLVQIERVPDDAALKLLSSGVTIEGERTRPADVHLLPREPQLPPRSVPIRFRKSIPTAWIELTLREGRNRQVRKMTAAAGHPTLRLMRIAVGSLTLAGLQPGEHRTLTPAELQALEAPAGSSPATFTVFP